MNFQGKGHDRKGPASSLQNCDRALNHKLPFADPKWHRPRIAVAILSKGLCASEAQRKRPLGLVKLRSPSELMFRAQQEAANLWLSYGPDGEAPCTHPLPLAQPKDFVSQLRGTPYERDLLVVAENILRREFALLGYTIQTDREIRWRRDYVNGQEKNNHQH